MWICLKHVVLFIVFKFPNRERVFKSFLKSKFDAIRQNCEFLFVYAWIKIFFIKFKKKNYTFHFPIRAKQCI